MAAYVGDSAKITEARVQEVWDDANAALTSAAASGSAEQPESAAAPAMPIKRIDIVRTLVGHDVLADVAEREGVSLPADLGLADHASRLRLPQTAEYVRLYAEFDGLLRALRTKVQSSAPEVTEDDLREVYTVLLRSGGVPAGTTFDQFKTSLPAENMALVKTAAAVRKEVGEFTGTADITVNPRYQPLTIPVLEFQTEQGELKPLVEVPLGESSQSTVTDVS
ncbi:hypothetical protein [Paractinoplanes lichenicola]|uniref:Uncharacterized protein n=1 Tax=Paractinoplanes lichenicola TaxID=2802976 RepID=A0ABS1VQB6_9ACTN|nr:hypothetical protein [Actinoplanes lichenicola]MBL7256914.1 hypothetical protein [Actinoplanes lichenicola]